MKHDDTRSQRAGRMSNSRLFGQSQCEARHYLPPDYRDAKLPGSADDDCTTVVIGGKLAKASSTSAPTRSAGSRLHLRQRLGWIHALNDTEARADFGRAGARHFKKMPSWRSALATACDVMNLR